MRRINTTILLIVMLCVLNGCAANFLKDEKCDAYLENAIEAIVEGDKETFQGLFWKEAMESSGVNLDEAADNVIQTWKGSLESYEMIGKYVDLSSKNFDTKTYVKCSYRVVTTEETYDVLVVRVEDKDGLDAMAVFYFEKNHEKR